MDQTIFLYQSYERRWTPKILLTEKLSKKWINLYIEITSVITYKINTFGDFYKETPTHLGATHTISKIKQKFQNRIFRERDQNFDILGISMIY